MKKITNELKSFIEIVGDENVLSNSHYLSNIETATYPTIQKISAVIKPSNKVELQKCIEIANEFKISVYPLSGGKNWGYGSKVPVLSDEIILDLSNLNKITDYNETLGYVTIEPGVTYQQLFNFLREKKSELLISITSSSTDSSLIGNIVERGIGTGLYAERLSNVSSFEVLLPNGKFIKTGFGELSDSISSKVYRWGSGPYTDGIFTQSNLGIVTELTLWLMPCPDHFQLLFYQVNNKIHFSEFINKLQKMTMKGLIRPTISLFNYHRVIANLSTFPWNNSDEIFSSLSIDKIENIKKYTTTKIDVGHWNGEISIRGMNKNHSDMQKNLIKNEIGNLIEKLVEYEVTKEEMLSILNNQYSATTKEPYDIVKDILIKKYLGIPNNSAIAQCYWRKKTSVPTQMNPDKDGCGLIWFSPIVPFQGNHLTKAIEIIETIVEKYQLEPAISLQCMSERAIHIIASISWDRELKGEDENAIKCYKEVRNALNNEGFHFYRESTLSMNEPYEKSNYIEFLQSIKKQVDPNNILAPGRYIKNTPS